MGASLKLTGLFLAMIGLFTAIGWIIGTVFLDDWITGSLVFLIIAAAINLISYFFSDKIVLRSYRAKIITKADQPRLYNVVNKVCLKANMPMPKIAIVPSRTPNAFATGRNEKTAVVAATEGIMSLLTDDELEGVIAHEMAHIKDKDMLVMTVAATIAGAISIVSRMALFSSMGRSRNNNSGPILLLVALTAPLAALMLRLAISRSREYKADREGSLTIQRPLFLASALEKLEEGNRRRPMQMGSPTSSSLFIVNPFSGGGFVSLFMTHPPVASRVRKLEQLADETGFISGPR
jgi:heat shock protein HtpX